MIQFYFKYLLMYNFKVIHFQIKIYYNQYFFEELKGLIFVVYYSTKL